MDLEEVTINDLADEMGVTTRTVWRRIKEHGGFNSEEKGPGKPSVINRKMEDVTCDKN